MKYLFLLLLGLGLMQVISAGRPHKEEYNYKDKNRKQKGGFENKKWSRQKQEERGQDRHYKKHENKWNQQDSRYQYHEGKKWKGKEQKHEAHKRKQIQNQQEVVSHQFQCNARPVYDSNILVLVWPIEYCEETGECNNEWKSGWDMETPVLRGFWPAGSDQYFYHCFGFEGDENCRKNAFQPNFNFENFLANNTKLMEKIDSFWSPYHFGEDSTFYKEEWVKHGMCYLMNMIEDNPKTYETDPAAFNRTILTQYFENGIEKWVKLDIVIGPEEEYLSKQEFAKVIGFEGKEDHFNLVCGKDNEVDQIHICFNRTRIPGKETTIACPPYDSCQKYEKFKFR